MPNIDNKQHTYQILVHGHGGHAKLTCVSELIAKYWSSVNSERVFGAHLQSDKSLNIRLDGTTIDPDFSAEPRHIVGPEKHKNLIISVADLNTKLIIWGGIKLSQATQRYGLRAIIRDAFMSGGQPKPWAVYRSFEKVTCRYILKTDAAFDAKLLQLHFAKFASDDILVGMTYDSISISFKPLIGEVLKFPVAAIIHALPVGLRRK